MDITLEPIGYVRNDFSQRPPTWQGTSSEIHVDARWSESLDGLEGFSHILVLCYLDKSRGQAIPLQVHPQGNPEMPLVGFWGTRTPVRPNPISVTTVPLVGREGSVLRVRNLDMFDGTPVLDLKPYLTRGDCHPEATAPDWIYRLWAIRDARDRERPNT